jgi:lon-related putative ATP-dependent protease
LRSGKIQIESLGAAMSLISTVSLRPEPIPLNVKVVLLGDRILYYLLQQHDPDFDELFKVAVDFNDETDRSTENCQLYAQMLATLAKQIDTRPLDRSAVALIIEQAARCAGDNEKLSTHLRSIADLIRESDHWAGKENANVVSANHVQMAIEQQIYRSDRIRQRVHEEIRRGTLLVDTEGQSVGQVNGLSVLSLGKFSFGRPSRITATARLGRGKVVDIEREVELGGAVHSKGVLILSSLLAARYAKDYPLSLSASLVFEQSYGMVDGDSASVAELCALLSTLANIPIKQNLAITGSLNQHGQAQPIGGVNEKIEGFFDVCSAIGLTNSQGVLIPVSNAKHLMLRPDVVQAVADGKFTVHCYHDIDDAITLLTGVEAGVQDSAGGYPSNTINFLVDRRLRELAELQRAFAEQTKRGER